MNKYVVGIGAANVDIYGKSSIKIREHFDHPSKIKTTVGGVTRNIIENVARLNVDCKLLSAVGDDIYGSLVIEKSKEAKIDVSKIKIVKNERTGIFMQVQNKNNDMHLALCDMSISKYIDIPYLKRYNSLLKKASLIVLDPSLDDEIINYLLDTYKDVPFFVDPISDLYAKKIKPYVGKIYCIKPNKSELEALTNVKIKNNNDVLIATKKLIKKGVKKVYVSLSKDGCLYLDDMNNCITKKFKPVKKMKNASGAGDAFYAAIIFGFINNLSINDTIDYALAAGICAISSEETINKEMSVGLLDKIIRENKNEL